MLRMNRLENSISFSAVFYLFFKAFSSSLWPAVCFEGGAGKNISELKRELEIKFPLKYVIRHVLTLL